jgi:hypothetical protein
MLLFNVLLIIERKYFLDIIEQRPRLKRFMDFYRKTRIGFIVFEVVLFL